MKKRFVLVLAVIALSAMLSAVLLGCDGTTDVFSALIDDASDDVAQNGAEEEARFGADELYSDNGYVDYAKEVYYDLESNPDLKNQGMFWCYWDDSLQQMIQVPASTAEGAALVDASKPTVICIHGMLSDGAVNQEVYNLNGRFALVDRDLYGYSSTQTNFNMIEMWIRKGWNVGMFNYNRFATESPTDIEEKVWDPNGTVGMTYLDSTSTRIDTGSKYSIAEHFAAEYIRAMKLLPETLGNQEIRFICHSMGGPVTAAGSFLLGELAKVGQISEKFLPDRITLMDSYFSVYIENDGKVLNLGPTGIKINWSGKDLVNGTTGDTIVSCLEILAHNGVAIEYYSYDASYLNACMSSAVKARLKNISMYVMMSPDYDDIYAGYSKAIDGHNSVREWYMCSLYGDVDADVPCAQMSTETVLSLRGTAYQIVSGSTTLTISDDVFEKVA